MFYRMAIESIFARQIFDSRGNPTVEVDLKTAKGSFALLVFYHNVLLLVLFMKCMFY